MTGGLEQRATSSPSVTITSPGAGAVTPVTIIPMLLCAEGGGDGAGTIVAAGTATPTSESGNPTRVAAMITAVGSHPDPNDPIPVGAADGNFDASWNWSVGGISGACCANQPAFPTNQVSVWVEFTNTSTGQVTRVVRNREFEGECTTVGGVKQPGPTGPGGPRQ